MKNYQKYLIFQKISRKDLIFKFAVGLSALFCLIYLFYAYALFFGGFLKWNKVMNGDEEYTGGTIITIMFCMMMGSFGLGNCGPIIKLMAEAQIGGKLAYDVIDHVPKVNVNQTGKEKIEKEQIKG